MRPENGVVLDAGFFIALERGNGYVTALAARLHDHHIPRVTSAGVVAQVWCTGDRAQAPIARLLRSTEVADLTQATARVLGRLLAQSGTSDPIDAHIVLLAQRRAWPVLTSDPDDLLRIDPALTVERV